MKSQVFHYQHVSPIELRLLSLPVSDLVVKFSSFQILSVSYFNECTPIIFIEVFEINYNETVIWCVFICTENCFRAATTNILQIIGYYHHVSQIKFFENVSLTI